jgi:pterin-4a-carbinolamine dehydratase
MSGMPALLDAAAIEAALHTHAEGGMTRFDVDLVRAISEQVEAQS